MSTFIILWLIWARMACHHRGQARLRPSFFAGLILGVFGVLLGLVAGRPHQGRQTATASPEYSRRGDRS